MINPGFLFISSLGPSPSRSSTPGLNGSMRMSARQRSLFWFPAHFEVLAALQPQGDLEQPAGGAERRVWRAETPSRDLRDTEMDRLLLATGDDVSWSSTHLGVRDAPRENVHVE